MTDGKPSWLDRFRHWCNRWDSTIGVVVGLVAVPGVVLAGVGLWLQYDQLLEAERDTSRQFGLMRETVSELSRQTTLEVGESTREASERFFDKLANPLYESLFLELETAKLDTQTPQDISDLEATLGAEFVHFQSTWQEVLNCDAPHCRVFDMLHKYHVRDICEVAASDIQRLSGIIGQLPGFDNQDRVADRLKKSVLGQVSCLCPPDWATWGGQSNPYCATANGAR